MKKNILLCMLCFPLWLFSQKSLVADSAFFSQQTQQYSKWLDEMGLSPYLKVKDFELKRTVEEKEKKIARVEKGHFSLRLLFLTQNEDSAYRIWQGLENAFNEKEKVSLEEILFNKMTYLVQVPDTFCSIQIQIKGNDRDKSLLRIYTKNNILILDNVKGKSVEPAPIRITMDGKKMTQTQFKAKYSQEKVFQKIMVFAKNRYETKKPNCEERKPQVKQLRSAENQLRFEVLDLCVEALCDEKENPLCEIYKKIVGDCNWKTREWLICTFTYLPNANGRGFSLYLSIEGKVGSGFYDELTRDAYHNMEIDHKEYLEHYANNVIMKELGDYLK